MNIGQLLNIKEPSRTTIINGYLKPLRKPIGKKWQHLNWKEKRRVRTLWLKMTKGKLTREEWEEYRDLSFVEIIATGQALEKEDKESYLEELRQKSEAFRIKEQRRNTQRKNKQLRKEEMSK
jgi:hypothetical protein